MEVKNIARILYYIGVIALIAGALDPLEGSVIIASGSALLAGTTSMLKDPHRKIFFWTFVAIVVGVASMFYLSSLGGIGGKSNLSWWYGSLVIPYPIGWLITIILLVFRGLNRLKKRKKNGDE
jgi:hypothetical protein